MNGTRPLLSRRQLQALSGAACGRTSREIGRELGISDRTAANYLCLTGEKLGVRRRAAMVDAAYRLGLLARPDRPPAAAPRTTPRRLQVLRLMAAGLSDREIAAELYTSPGTVMSHAAQLYADLGARSRAHAVAIGHQYGLLGAEDPAATARTGAAAVP